LSPTAARIRQLGEFLFQDCRNTHAANDKPGLVLYLELQTVTYKTNMSLTSQCRCGRVAFEALGKPIVSAACHCADCRAGAGQLAALGCTGPVQNPDGGTPYIVYRRDRFRCLRGAELLRGHKLRGTSATKRVVASCCNTPMMLSFDDAKWWVSAYRTRFEGELPPLRMHVCAGAGPGGGRFGDGLPVYPGFAFTFVARLLTARLAMLLGL
jgi:hypothetical protein